MWRPNYRRIAVMIVNLGAWVAIFHLAKVLMR